jgi:hypothetical protein
MPATTRQDCCPYRGRLSPSRITPTPHVAVLRVVAIILVIEGRIPRLPGPHRRERLLLVLHAWNSAYHVYFLLACTHSAHAILPNTGFARNPSVLPLEACRCFGRDPRRSTLSFAPGGSPLDRFDPREKCSFLGGANLTFCLASVRYRKVEIKQRISFASLVFDSREKSLLCVPYCLPEKRWHNNPSTECKAPRLSTLLRGEPK